MNEQNDHIWMHKKPETVFDWLAIIAISIALYLMLGHLNVFAGGIAKFLDVVAPFASGIVIAYVLETTCGTTMETNSVMISAATMYAIRIESQRSLGFSFITYRCTGRTIQSST